jgi:hypothetical protein
LIDIICYFILILNQTSLQLEDSGKSRRAVLNK